MAAVTTISRNRLRIRSTWLSLSSIAVKCAPQPRCPSSSPAASISSVPEPPSASFSQPRESRSVSRWSSLLLFLPGAVTFGLGTWQIFRRQEKIKVLEHRQNRLSLEPIPCYNIDPSSESLNSLEFRRVVYEGVFDERKSIYVGPRSRSISGVTGNGYYIITPFLPIPTMPGSLQRPVLVNRGWVPRSWKDRSLKVPKDDEQPPSIESSSVHKSSQPWWKFWSRSPDITKERVRDFTPVKVVGVVRGSERPSIFVPANDPASFQWFYVDISEIARACGLPESTIYIEAINDNVDTANPYPIPKDTNELIRSSVMPQDHLNYTLTWYSLSAAVTFMAFKRINPKKKNR